MPEHYRAYWLCKTMHWSELDYLDASAAFCDDVIEYWNLEQAVLEQQRSKGK